jgi:CRISPR-associated protein Csm2
MSDIESIITDAASAEALVSYAEELGRSLKNKGLATNQIRALFGEVRRIEGEWSIDRQRALRRLVLLKPKMAYRARKERGQAVKMLVNVLDPAIDFVVQAPDRPAGASPGTGNNKDDNFQRFVELFEAILAYHKAFGGR